MSRQLVEARGCSDVGLGLAKATGEQSAFAGFTSRTIANTRIFLTAVDTTMPGCGWGGLVAKAISCSLAVGSFRLFARCTSGMRS